MKAFVVVALAGATLAGSSPAAEPMITRYFRIPPTVSHNVPTDAAVISDGLETDDFARSEDVRPMLEGWGVKFPEGASATYYPQPVLIGITNTSENIREFVRKLKIFDFKAESVRLQVRLVEFAAAEALQQGASIPLAEWEKDFEKKAKTVSISTLVTRSGHRAFAVVDTANDPGNKGKLPANLRDPNNERRPGDWPLPPGVESAYLEADPVFRDNTVEMSLIFKYASPPTEAKPEIRSELSADISVKAGHILTARSFTSPDRSGALRSYAVLVSFTLLDQSSRTLEEAAAKVPSPSDKAKTR